MTGEVVQMVEPGREYGTLVCQRFAQLAVLEQDGVGGCLRLLMHATCGAERTHE